MTAPLFRPRERPWSWAGVWLLGIALVAVGSLLPASQVPSMAVPGLDKVNHVIGHGALSAYAVMLFVSIRARALAALALFTYGVGIEFAQEAFTATREASLGDVLANALGIGLGQCVAATRLRDLLQRLDAQLPR